MKRKPLALLISLALTHTAFAQDVVVFGDSLSDIGQNGWAFKASYNDEKNQPHKLYDEIVAEALGGTLAASSKGGTDYAYSGGVILPEHSTSAAAQPQVDITKQIQSYLNDKQKADADALYIVWGGGNDAAAILTTAAGSTDPAAAQTAALADIQTTAATNAAQVAALQKAGANLIVVPNTPNVFNTPKFFEAYSNIAIGKVANALPPVIGRAFTNKMTTYFQEAAAEQTASTDLMTARNAIIDAALDKYWADSGTAGIRSMLEDGGKTKDVLAAQFKEGLNTMQSSAATVTTMLNGNTNLALRQLGGNIVRLDVDQLFSDMLADPKGYGFGNVATPACSESSATKLCTQADGVAGSQQAAADADQRLFADSFHPGPAAHQIMADYLLSTLKAPSQAALIGKTAVDQSRDTWAFAREQSNANRTQRQAPATFDAIVSAEGGTDSTHNLHIGGKAQWNENWQSGFVYSRLNQHPDNNGIDIKSESNVLTAYTRYDQDRWWLGGGVQFADGDYRIGRHIQLGPKHITQRAETTGNTQSASLFGGYEMPVSPNGKVDLLAHATYTRGKIQSYVEQEKGATRMSFDKQHLSSVQTGIGAQYNLSLGQVSAYARALFEREWKDPEAVRTGMGGLTFETGKPDFDKNSIHTALGANWQVGKNLRVFGQIGHRFGSSDSAGNTVGQIGLSAVF